MSIIPRMSEPQLSTPRERVVAEKRRRGWSARMAAQAAGISNTTWSVFERDGRVSDIIRHGVAAAFGWPTSWPEVEVPFEPDAQQALMSTMDEKLREGLETALASHQRILDAVEALAARIDAVDAKVDAVIAELLAHREAVEPDAGVDAVLDRLAQAVDNLAVPPRAPRAKPAAQRKPRGRSQAG